MHIVRHPLASATPGTTHELVSLHYGTPGQGPKVTIQGSLHADEVPGMLVAHHLRNHLDALEAAGRLRGEVVLVPMANPLGVGQWVLRGFQGRFELHSGENFNRHFANLTDAVLDRVMDRLGADAAENVRLVRGALREAVAALGATSPLESLRKTLLGLAIDADVVLDLHCDGEALLHLYTTPQTWPGDGQLLARCIGAELALLAERSGGDPFDEACSMVWPQLAERLGPAKPLPPACMAATIELRGEADVRHDLAAADAQGIVDFLIQRGVVAPEGGTLPALPPLKREATPLAGSIPVVAPTGGMVVFLQVPGASVVAGQPLVDLIDPLTGQVTTLGAPVDGLFFARDLRRFAVAGMSLGKVAGREATRAGSLLSA
ncbi:succinylglutamate desuccinylase/aspartoacylase family protein [Ideonella dechloratans]|uniref:Succinylglutamate desuccinylase/aspartoacylase family protein n=1 Tax=Ideonella dechloratans TaxID=36863 RepID=A0A643FD10_IDEDE|nr:succinylglutamate desuccinylase/aspartoacylase family protein [Ideonella dechloratans]KAB0579344.1 succinylglutamate desuccinylase/aspartoacylase family protein [Ideonella dechloratans]UFU09741.1 M14 family metallopeptidase [Ideonella dechloratans]